MFLSGNFRARTKCPADALGVQKIFFTIIFPTLDTSSAFENNSSEKPLPGCLTAWDMGYIIILTEVIQ